MRERRGVRRWFVVGLGITPAYAGKTLSKRGFEMYREDHPRVCGKDIWDYWDECNV